MHELGLDKTNVADWFSNRHEAATHLLVLVPVQAVQTWATALGVPLRRCYVGDRALAQAQARSGRTASDLVSTRLPDPGSTMSGDFGEILTAIFQSADGSRPNLLEPKKWRLKQDRRGPAPYTDIVQFHVPEWPNPSENDAILAAEVKTKATNGTSAPIPSAIDGAARDRDDRLTKTLVWLRERSLFEDLGTVTTEHLERFISGLELPPYSRHYRAVAVVSSELADKELLDAPAQRPEDIGLVVISVPELKLAYEAVYQSAVNHPEADRG